MTSSHRDQNRDRLPCIIGAAHPRTRHITDDVHFKLCDKHWTQTQRIRRENIVRLRAFRLTVAKDVEQSIGMLRRHFTGR